VIVSEMSHTENLPDPASVVLRRRIEWIDTDAAGINRYTTAFRLAEAAEAAMHTALGIADRTFGATPRVGAEMAFKRSLRFNDEVETTLAVTAVLRASVSYAFTLAGPDGVAAVGPSRRAWSTTPPGRATPCSTTCADSSPPAGASKPPEVRTPRAAARGAPPW
jgi:acyl-CoA thioester hydrolase